MLNTFLARVAILSLSLMLTAWSATAGTLTTLYAFDTNHPNDGNEPDAGLAYDNGLLYGTTRLGVGSCPPGNDGCGTLFGIDPSTGAEKTLIAFVRKDKWPRTTLLVAGKFVYGTSSYAMHPTTFGTIFSMSFAPLHLKLIHQFSGGADGFEANALIESGGLLYGTSSAGGGPSSTGLLFSLDLKTGVKTTLHNFGSSPDDGAVPVGGLTFYKGSLYGTTAIGGGGNSPGTIFKYDPATTTYGIAASFQGSGNQDPVRGLASDGHLLYGVAHSSGSSGSVYSFDPATAEIKTLHVFAGGNDAQNPNGPLTVVDSILYGTSTAGGSKGFGTIFKVNKVTGAERVVYNFTGGRDGASPFAELLFENGSFYGTTTAGGVGDGTVFSFVP